MNRILEIIEATTQVFRKGPEIVKTKGEHIDITEVFAMPPVDEAGDLIQIDVVFMVVGVDREKAIPYRYELFNILRQWSPMLSSGPSYIAIGSVITGDQGLALRLMALGKVLDLWKVITPITLGIPESRAAEIAGLGYIMISGFRQLEI